MNVMLLLLVISCFILMLMHRIICMELVCVWVCLVVLAVELRGALVVRILVVKWVVRVVLLLVHAVLLLAVILLVLLEQ